MPIYIVLFKSTDQGIRNIKGAPQRIEAAHKAVEAAGGKTIAYYATMGEYDYVGIYESPSDEVTMTLLLATGSLGNVRTTTLKAFTQEAFAGIIMKLP